MSLHSGLTEEQNASIEEQRLQTQKTRRVSVEALEEVLFDPLPVLDHGFIRVVDYMGDDSAIVQAARVSYGRGTKHVSNDRGLISYLMRHRHTSPFEMCEIKLHVKLPIFVARQWIRHRTANVNEYSARYSVLSDDFYIPADDQLAAQADTNRQGRGAQLDGAEREIIAKAMRENGERAYAVYRSMLGEEKSQKPGLAREIARAVLPLNIYTEWYWKTDLHNLFQFIALRADPHAQYEIRAYAEILLEVVRRWTPLAAEAFEQYRMKSAEFSKSAIDVLRRMLDGENISQEDSGMSPREWRELMSALGRE